MLEDLTFERPVGAAADSKELEYITALHQTTDDEDETYRDGSIDANDVAYYLISRYGMSVPIEDIRQTIFKDLAGGEKANECIDICELVAILLIPFFVKSVKGKIDFNEVESNDSTRIRGFQSEQAFQAYVKDIQFCNSLVDNDVVIQHVLNIILDESIGNTNEQRLTPDIMKKIFERYDELELSQDDQLIKDMIEDVTGGDPNVLFNRESFAGALSNDVMLYNVDHEVRVSTFYDDVFGMEWKKKTEEDNHSETNPLRANEENHSDIEEPTESNDSNHGISFYERVRTFSQIDLLADTCASKVHMIIAYVAYFLFFFMFQNTDDNIEVCVENAKTFGCQIADRIVYFFIVMAFNISLGVPWILLLTSGNTINGTSFVNFIFFGAGISLLIVLSRVVYFDFFLLSNKDAMVNLLHYNEANQSAMDIGYNVLMSFLFSSLGNFLMVDLLLYLMPSIRHSKKWIVNRIFNQGTFREVFRVKLASSLKTTMLVKNAFDLHIESFGPSKTNLQKSSTSSTLALLNFSKVIEKTEKYGGLLFCWKNLMNHSFTQREGVVINSRLILANSLQFLLFFLLLFYIPTVTLRSVLPMIFPSLLHQDVKCSSMTFNADNCSFSAIGGYSMGIGVCHGVQLDYENCAKGESILTLDEFEGSEGFVTTLCTGLEDLLNDGSNDFLSLLYHGGSSDDFVDILASVVVNEGLCRGLNTLNRTLWFALTEEHGIDTSSCQVPRDDFCHEQQIQTTTLTNVTSASYNAVLEAYQPMYRETTERVVNCVVTSNLNNMTTVNGVLGDIADSMLKGALLGTAENSWKLLFANDLESFKPSYDVPVDAAINTWLHDYLGSDILDQYTKNDTIFEFDEILNRVSAPELVQSSPEAITEHAMILVDGIFTELETMIEDVIVAQKSNLAQLPTYFSTNVSIQDICQSSWIVDPSLTILLDTVGSNKDYFCRAQLTGCVNRTGVCLIGANYIRTKSGIGIPVPYQIHGERCMEYPKLSLLMETKESVGIIDTFLPTSRLLVNIYLWTSITIGLIILLILAMLFLPNVVLTTLKFRTGVIPSLRNPRFKSYRRNLAYLTFLVPSVFWSTFAMTILVYTMIMLLIIIFLWERTRSIMISLSAMLIATGSTVMFKRLMVMCFGRHTFEGFYRKRPAVVNIVALAYECWHIFLSIGFVVARALKLLALAVIFIGRSDRPFLAEDIALDNQPHILRQAILAYEAHRHPYIERLGMMYLMKLKHGNNFGRRSSSTWRLLFVFALMPWLRKYRIANYDAGSENDAILLQNIELKKRCEEVDELKHSIMILSSANKKLLESRVGSKTLLEGRVGQDDEVDISFENVEDEVEEEYTK